MIQVLLLTEYKDSRKGDIISVSNNVAFGLEETGVGRRVGKEEFLKRTDLGQTKAMNQPPSKRRIMNTQDEGVRTEDADTKADSVQE